MTISDYRKIWMKAVERYQPPTGKPCATVQGYYFADSPQFITDLKDGQSAKYSEFASGLFWAKNWYHSGQSISNICFEFPLILQYVENQTGVLNNCLTIQTWMLSQADCQDCPNTCKRPSQIQKEETQQTLIDLIKYIRGFSLCEVTNLGNTIESMFERPEFLTEQLNQAKVLGFTDTQLLIESGIDFQTSQQIREFNLQTNFDLIGFGVQQIICPKCEGGTSTFATSVTIPKTKGAVKCPTCL